MEYVLFRVPALEATSVKLFVRLFPDLRGSLSKSKNQNLVSQRDKIIEWELFDSYFKNCKKFIIMIKVQFLLEMIKLVKAINYL